MYIVFEGIVGSGKSTQSKKLVSYLQEHFPEREVVLVREPGTTPISEDIRHLAQSKEWDEVMHPLTNAYLYAASRAQSLHTVVEPAISRGAIVVSDRSFISSLAYQGEVQWLGFDRVLAINTEAIRGILPSIVFYMDIPVETALSRTFDSVGDKWEKMGPDFFEHVVVGYKKSANLPMLRGIWVEVSAEGSKEVVFDGIVQKLNERGVLSE